MDGQAKNAASMKTPLAFLNLLQNRTRTAAAAGGVTFAVVLMFMQLGFLESARTTATVIYEAMRFDLCLRSKDYLHLADSRTIPESRLRQSASVPGVKEVNPFLIGRSPWREPEGLQRAILVMGVDWRRPIFKNPLIVEQLPRLDVAESVLIDEMTSPEYGPRDRLRFGENDHGATSELGGRTVRIVGHFPLGTGFSANGALLTSARSFADLFPQRPRRTVNLGLVVLEPGADVGRVAADLRRTLPADVEVLDRSQVLRQELRYWVDETSYGLIFKLGCLVAFLVGTSIVYQVLSSDVASLLPEYATLKAIGYHDRYLVGVVVRQSLMLAAAGYLVGIVLSTQLYSLTTRLSRMPIGMTWKNGGTVLFLTTVMCVGSAFAALQKLRKADPADLF